MAKYYYACSFENKQATKYTYASSIKLNSGDLVVVPSPWGCGFAIVEVHERIMKKDVNYDVDKLTHIVCRLKNTVYEVESCDKFYTCCVNGTRSKIVILASPVKLKPGDMVVANTEKRCILNVLGNCDKREGAYYLIQKLYLKRFENRQEMII